MNAVSQGLLAGLDKARTAKVAKGLSFRLTDFLWAIVEVEQQAIDTKEERDEIANDLMGWYNTWVSSYVPEPFRVSTASYVLATIITALEAAAAIKRPAPTPAPLPPSP